jgi:hypothetical protein
MRFLQISCGCLFIVAACGGAPGSPLDDGGPGSDGSSNYAPTNDSGNNDSGNSDSGNSGDGAACVDEHGRYTMVMTGAGCGPTATDVKECITETSCTITIMAQSTQLNAGISGTTPIQNDGSFTGATIMEGTMMRSGCVGAWDSGTSTLTIDCGGMNTAQSCRATLVRTSLSCN